VLSRSAPSRSQIPFLLEQCYGIFSKVESLLSKNKGIFGGGINIRNRARAYFIRQNHSMERIRERFGGGIIVS
jgi:hypothetical protein